MRFNGMVVAVVLVMVCAFGSHAQAEGIFRFAGRLNRSGGLFHDSTAGREVVYRSSGRANRFEARAAWRNSPAHAAILPSVRRIVCRGNVCVGR